MINKVSRNEVRQARHARVRTKVSGTSSIPRLNVFRSNSNIFAQIIDDDKKITLAYATTINSKLSGTKTELATAIGKEIAEKAKKAKIKQVVFDRGSLIYAGRLSALADAARKEGLEF